ncbi:RagB/SusD family nutrient uptake outer membrane protein [Bacteroides sp. 51]|uniref:RagB/SusD family nutrient uptake outer membrane protein n=1 Tax=Bacteroides sp. 51 TaxID=2302938 RepID=UPI0013D5F5C6|nr:RagB/SusD family nutrient uptake outer membrane protein [Bacteroides sp. 51]NDV81891.1 RagB/SusD family nutrient uptake outer membrane protein [Bacteroides sp. 51]
MKKYILLLISSLILVTSCESWLEEEQFNKVNNEALYKNEDGLTVALNGLYSLTRTFFTFALSDSYQGIYWFYCADDLSLVRTKNEWYIYRAGMVPDKMPTEIWNRPYQMIDRASAIITSAPKIEMSTDNKNRIVSEARVIRAWSYIRLLNTYDNILLDTIPTTPENAFGPVEYKPAIKTDVLKLINSDLDFAIKNLAYKVDPGIIGKGLARQLRAESAMLGEDYTMAALQCDSIAEYSGHGLVPINEVFGDNVNHKETLFAWQYDELSGGSSDKAGGTGNQYGGCFTARFYMLRVAGDTQAPILESVEYGGNSLGWCYPNSYLRSLYDEDVDQRMTHYFYPDELYANNPKSKYYGQKLPGNPPYSTQLMQYAWSLKKYHDNSKVPTTARSYKPLVSYRYAETCLLGAEAHWRNGNTGKALEYLNAVRKRAGLDNETTIDLQKVMDEDARELCFEGKRWFFLKRIGKLVEQVNKYHQIGSTTSSIVPFPMKDYMVRWPIPQSQINVMGTFPQNPEY